MITKELEGDYMGQNKVKVTGFRIEDKVILDKLKVIAKMNMRTRSKEVEFALKKYVQDFEQKHGIIELPKNLISE